MIQLIENIITIRFSNLVARNIINNYMYSNILQWGIDYNIYFSINNYIEYQNYVFNDLSHIINLQLLLL